MAGMGNLPPLKEVYEDVEYVVIGAGNIRFSQVTLRDFLNCIDQPG